jgi:hypothetical protein
MRSIVQLNRAGPLSRRLVATKTRDREALVTFIQ